MRTINKQIIVKSINECKNIKEVGDTMNLETRINHPNKNATGNDMNDISQNSHDELIFIRHIEQNWEQIKKEIPRICLPRCVDDKLIDELYKNITTYCPNRHTMSYGRIQEAIDMMFLIE